MTEISASMVKDLREKTGAGMMDCKRALGETQGNIEEAIDWLRKKGLAAAAKKAGRVAAEGLVGVAASGNVGAAVEINAETDFVARNDAFQKLVADIAKLVLTVGDNVETLKNTPYPGASHSVADEITRLIATIGENMSLRRAKRYKLDKGVVATYMHGALVPGLGKIGVLVAFDSAASSEQLTGLGKQLAMHIAAANPMAATIAEVDSSTVERERNILAEQARASGKSEDVIAKMVDGRLRKFYEENVLTEQVFVVDGETKIRDLLTKAGKDFGSEVKLAGFTRFALGEGIEKEETDFAAEVAAQVAKK